MSPGATFERVYNELKRMLAEGELLPGAPIEPAVIGKQIASSITPVRDALHRLTGERMVEAPNHNGFRAPLLTEAALRDLYNWNRLVMGLAVRQLGKSDLKFEAVSSVSLTDLAASTARLFFTIAQRTGSNELIRAVQHLNDRLALYRRVEPALIEDTAEESMSMTALLAADDRAGLASLIGIYHRRRVRIVPEILSSLARQTRSVGS